jgi:5'-nucleotidase (lipoprotein e(P4) family)
MYRIILIFFPIVLWSQNPTDFNNLNELPNEIKWVTQSKEYIKLCQQIYQTAIIAVRQQSQGNINPFIVMDLDETVLDNSQYQIDLFNKSEKYNPKSWNKWVKKQEAKLVPGAKDFILRYKKIKNAKIIFLSNRDNTTLMATKNNMKDLGIFFSDDIFLLRLDKEDTKINRREEVFLGKNRMKTYGAKKIIAYFGDAMGDFPEDKSYKFGINKFIFPNPMYGKW